MYFRFGSALVLLILISVAGVAIEKQCLALRRAVSRQQYRYDALCELASRLRLKTEQLGAPVRLYATLERGQLELSRPNRVNEPSPSRRPRPLSVLAIRPETHSDR